MNKIAIDWKHIDEYIADPIEYRFIDKVEVIPGSEAWGVKLASSLDWYFKAHFPNDPAMPEGFIMETIMQTGVFIITTLPETDNKLMMFQSCESMKIYGLVRPGDIIDTHVSLKSYRHGIAKYFGEARVGEHQVCSMEFTLISKNEILKVSPQSKEVQNEMGENSLC